MKEGHGKKDYQRMKPYIIYNYLIRNSDEAHTIKIALERKEKADEDNSTVLKNVIICMSKELQRAG